MSLKNFIMHLNVLEQLAEQEGKIGVYRAIQFLKEDSGEISTSVRRQVIKTLEDCYNNDDSEDLCLELLRQYF